MPKSKSMRDLFSCTFKYELLSPAVLKRNCMTLFKFQPLTHSLFHISLTAIIFLVIFVFIVKLSFYIFI